MKTYTSIEEAVKSVSSLGATICKFSGGNASSPVMISRNGGRTWRQEGQTATYRHSGYEAARQTFSRYLISSLWNEETKAWEFLVEDTQAE